VYAGIQRGTHAGESELALHLNLGAESRDGLLCTSNQDALQCNWVASLCIFGAQRRPVEPFVNLTVHPVADDPGWHRKKFSTELYQRFDD
jgi:hypothetical protein